MLRIPRFLFHPVAELACILAATVCANLWTADLETVSSGLMEAAGLWVVFGAIWLLIGHRLGIRLIPPNRNLSQSLRRTIETWAATWGIAGMLTTSLFALPSFNIWISLVVGMALLALLRLSMSFSSQQQVIGRPRALVLGACPSARALSSTADTRDAVEFIGFVPFRHEDEDEDTMPHLPRIGRSISLKQILEDNQIDIVFVSPSDEAVTGEVHGAIDICEHLGIQTQYFPSFLAIDGLSVGLTWSANRPGLSVQATSPYSLAAINKRLLDIVGATVGIILLLPVLVACAIAVKLMSPGPILFRQTRIGKQGRSFSCLKFRTMRVGAHAQQELLRATSLQDGPAFKVAGDPRITSIGGILRKFSLDELPQLFNVLVGEMSLVGPRPPIPSEVENYTWWQRRRITIKPGLTCIWQVYGRNRVSFKRWVEMDLFYIDNSSMWMDLKLIVHTLRVVIRGTGM